MSSSNEGINKLARTLQSRVKRLNNAPPLLDFGVIQGDMSLLTNKFPLPIPQSDYVICRSVCYDPKAPLTMTWWQNDGGNKEAAEEASKGQHSHDEDAEGKHCHGVHLPRKMYRIQPGDRVLVAWVGDDPVVVDIIMAAMEMM